MNKLEEARLVINDVDKQMAELFEKRFKAVEEVIAYKMEQGLPIFDSSREEALVARNLSYIQDEELKPFYEEAFRYIMKVSKDYQQHIVDKSEH
mgnify:FL=1